MRRSRCWSVLASFTLAACGAAAPDAAPREPAPEPLELTLVLLKTGPRTEPLGDAERGKVFGGHFGNMQRLAREGHLLVAGPYGRAKSDPALRGLFVLDTADRDRARQLAETDPGFQAGVFALDYHRLTTTAPLRAFLAAEMAALEAAAAAGRTPPPGEGSRLFVLLTAENGDAALAALEGLPGVLWLSRLDGERAFALLDAQDRQAAQTLLQPVADRLGACRLDEWFASSRLAELPAMARAGG